jgi:DNA-binding response OmpR family regulator
MDGVVLKPFQPDELFAAVEAGAGQLVPPPPAEPAPRPTDAPLV